jgi:hypothetical protein
MHGRFCDNDGEHNDELIMVTLMIMGMSVKRCGMMMQIMTMMLMTQMMNTTMVMVVTMIAIYTLRANLTKMPNPGDCCMLRN